METRRKKRNIYYAYKASGDRKMLNLLFKYDLWQEWRQEQEEKGKKNLFCFIKRKWKDGTISDKDFKDLI